MRSALKLVQSYKADITRAAEVVTSKKARGPSGVGFRPRCQAGWLGLREVVGCLNQRVDDARFAD